MIDESFDLTEQGYPEDEEENTVQNIHNDIEQTRVKIACAAVAAVKPP